MTISSTNPPNQITNPSSAIPIQIVQDNVFVDSANPLAVTISNEHETQSIVTNSYIVLTGFTDGSTTVAVNDILQNIQVFDSDGTLVNSIWQDLTQFVILTNSPPTADISIVSGSGLTNVELRAAPVPFSSTQLPVALGQTVMASSLPVVLASDQSALNVVVTVPTSTVLNGQVTANGTATAFPSGVLSNAVVLTSLTTNTSTVYVGGSGITSASGYPLIPGQSIGYVVSNLNDVYYLGASGGTIAYTGN
jgi:hypothetical protein